MRYLIWAFRIAVFLVLLGFALKNTDPVVVHFYLGRHWQAPLVFILLLVFAVGAVAGLLASLGLIYRQRRELVGLRKQLRAHAAEESR